MRKLITVFFIMLSSLTAIAGGDQNHGTTGSGSTSTGSTSSGSATQQRTGQ